MVADVLAMHGTDLIITEYSSLNTKSGDTLWPCKHIVLMHCGRL